VIDPHVAVQGQIVRGRPVGAREDEAAVALALVPRLLQRKDRRQSFTVVVAPAPRQRRGQIVERVAICGGLRQRAAVQRDASEGADRGADLGAVHQPELRRVARQETAGGHRERRVEALAPAIEKTVDAHVVLGAVVQSVDLGDAALHVTREFDLPAAAEQVARVQVQTHPVHGERRVAIAAAVLVDEHLRANAAFHGGRALVRAPCERGSQERRVRVALRQRRGPLRVLRGALRSGVRRFHGGIAAARGKHEEAAAPGPWRVSAVECRRAGAVRRDGDDARLDARARVADQRHRIADLDAGGGTLIEVHGVTRGERDTHLDALLTRRLLDGIVGPGRAGDDAERGGEHDQKARGPHRGTRRSAPNAGAWQSRHEVPSGR